MLILVVEAGIPVRLNCTPEINSLTLLPMGYRAVIILAAISRFGGEP